jgi:Protein of unknown function (DUF2934)
LKSTREPKERKKKEIKPRKSSAKNKQALESTDSLHEETSPAPISNGAGDSVNGAVAPEAVIVESIVVEIEPPYEEIAARAYQLFVDRGYQHGRHVDDWLDAERELRSKHRSA